MQVGTTGGPAGAVVGNGQGRGGHRGPYLPVLMPDQQKITFVYILSPGGDTTNCLFWGQAEMGPGIHLHIGTVVDDLKRDEQG
jgi:hypothetical protein